MSNVRINQQFPDHHFRTEIPNIIFEMIERGDLKHQDFIVYCVLKKIAGDHGCCTYKMDNLAKKCACHKDTLRESLRRLKKNFPLLGYDETIPNGVPLIEIYQRKGENGSDLPHEIIIRDVWRKNGNYFREKKELKKELQGGKNHTPPLGSNRPNKEPLKEEPKSISTLSLEPKKKKEPNPRSAKASPTPSRQTLATPEEQKRKEALEEVDFFNSETQSFEKLSSKDAMKIAKTCTHQEISFLMNKLKLRRDNKLLQPLISSLAYFIEMWKSHRTR